MARTDDDLVRTRNLAKYGELNPSPERMAEVDAQRAAEDKYYADKAALRKARAKAEQEASEVIDGPLGPEPPPPDDDYEPSREGSERNLLSFPQGKAMKSPERPLIVRSFAECVAEMRSRPPFEWLIDKLIQPNNWFIIQSAPNVGKSLMLAAIASEAIKSGRHVLAIEEEGIDGFVKQLLDMRIPEDTKLLRLIGDQSFNIENPEHWIEVTDFVHEHPDGMVLGDSFADLHNRDESSGKEMIAVLRSIGEIGKQNKDLSFGWHTMNPREGLRQIGPASMEEEE